MKTKFCTPEDINGQLVSYPQCTDNQAIPKSIFEKIVKNNDVSLKMTLTIMR